MSARTLYDIYVPHGNAKVRVAQYSNLDSAVEEVKRMLRQDPTRAVRLEVIPPEHQEPPRPPDDFEQRLKEALGSERGTLAEQSALAARTSYAIGQMGRTIDDALLVASWEREHGEDEPNPYLTLLQKRTDQHHAAVERAAEEALQGGQYGVRVDVYPTRTEARVDPTVPYGCKTEHQHLTDPLDRA